MVRTESCVRDTLGPSDAGVLAADRGRLRTFHSTKSSSALCFGRLAKVASVCHDVVSILALVSGSLNPKP